MSDDLVTWGQIGDMMRRALRELNEERMPSFALEWVTGLPLDFHISTDLACEHFLANGEWPEEIDEVTRMLLVIRCLFVIDHIISRIAQGQIQPTDKGVLHIRIYLIEQWYREYVGWLDLRNPNGHWNFPFDPWMV